MITVMRTGLTLAFCLTLGACSSMTPFPPYVLKDVDTAFDFNAWRAAPSVNEGRKVQIGGRVIQAEWTDRGTVIVGMQLPIVDHPAYGPSEPRRRTGVYEFAFLYPGKIELGSLAPGNRFIVVGTTQRAQTVTVEGAPKTEPYLIARCVHIWKTEGREISDFPEVGGGYYPLEENTYCAPGE